MLRNPGLACGGLGVEGNKPRSPMSPVPGTWSRGARWDLLRVTEASPFCRVAGAFPFITWRSCG